MPSVAHLIFVGFNAVNSTLIIGGNLLVIVAIFRRPKLRNSPTNHLIASLSFADVFVGAVFIPVRSFGLDWVVSEFVCDFVMTTSWTCLNSTIFTLMGIAVDRYRAIVTPMKRQVTINQARLMILLAWTASAFYSINYALINGIKTKTVRVAGQNATYIASSCSYLLSDHLEVITVLNFTILYILPMLVLIALYGKVIGVLYFGNSPNDSSRRRKRRAVRMLIIVVAMFALAWFPIRIMRTIIYIKPSLVAGPGFKYLRPFITSLALANSWMNPVVYAIFGGNFRREFATILGCGRYSRGGGSKKEIDLGSKSTRKEGGQVESSSGDRKHEPSTDKESIRPHSVDQIHPKIQTIATQTEDNGLCSCSHSKCYGNEAFEITAETKN
ncbi:QRFP-like peptide receptor [Ptychodera flava]|uniref:QRFP-like peptide receptor n=1 Tax=Ptychodera flava TaxID=63121 RepID=UPI00396A6851